MNELTAQTLRGLLHVYDTAIAELRAMHDPEVEALIGRMVARRGEAVSALAEVKTA